jgi:hypothetical protein
MGAFTSGGSGCDYPAEDDVVAGVTYGDGAYTGTFECDVPPSPAEAGAMPFAAISAGLVSRVAQALGTTTDFVRPVSNDDYVVTETENLFAYLRAYGPSPVNPTTGGLWSDDGAGRWRTVVGRRVRVYIYTRSGTDSYGSDAAALQGADPGQLVTTPPTMPGQFVLEECVLNALQNYQMTYTDDDDVVHPLTCGPIHWVDSESGPPVRKRENDDGLTRSHLDFIAVYVLAIQRTEPAPDGLPTPSPM